MIGLRWHSSETWELSQWNSNGKQGRCPGKVSLALDAIYKKALKGKMKVLVSATPGCAHFMGI